MQPVGMYGSSPNLAYPGYGHQAAQFQQGAAAVPAYMTRQYQGSVPPPSGYPGAGIPNARPPPRSVVLQQQQRRAAVDVYSQQQHAHAMMVGRSVAAPVGIAGVPQNGHMPSGMVMEYNQPYPVQASIARTITNPHVSRAPPPSLNAMAASTQMSHPANHPFAPLASSHGQARMIQYHPHALQTNPHQVPFAQSGVPSHERTAAVSMAEHRAPFGQQMDTRQSPHMYPAATEISNGGSMGPHATSRTQHLPLHDAQDAQSAPMSAASTPKQDPQHDGDVQSTSAPHLSIQPRLHLSTAGFDGNSHADLLTSPLPISNHSPSPNGSPATRFLAEQKSSVSGRDEPTSDQTSQQGDFSNTPRYAGQAYSQRVSSSTALLRLLSFSSDLTAALNSSDSDALQNWVSAYFSERAQVGFLVEDPNRGQNGYGALRTLCNVSSPTEFTYVTETSSQIYPWPAFRDFTKSSARLVQHESRCSWNVR